MSPSKRLAQTSSRGASDIVYPGNRTQTTLLGRDGLGAYLASPGSFPPSRVLYHNTHFVVVHDLYPKSSVHILVIPRHPSTKLHPFDAFEGDADLLQRTKEEVEKVKSMVAAELRRRYGKYSESDRARIKFMTSAEEPSDGTLCPAGRDWGAEILAGVHAGPSMNHLHAHVLSKDRFSESLKHRKHYNSFATPFMVPFEELPLPVDDTRRNPDRGGYLRGDMKCWKCGRNFGNRFQELKRHLHDEFEEWKRE